MITVGQLRKRLTILSPVDSTDPQGYGQTIPQYEDYAECWGSVTPYSGRNVELSNADTMTSIADYKIVIRYREDIQVGVHRIRLGTPTCPDYDHMTGQQYDQLTSEEYDELVSNGKLGVHYYNITAAYDPDGKRVFLMLLAVEVTG